MNSWKVRAELPSEFVIKITQGLLNPSNTELCGYGESKRRIVFVDSNVFHYFGSKIVRYFKDNDIEAKVISIDISEEKKSLESLMFILQTVEDFSLLRRSEPIIAIGGGVLLDIVGLAASIYRRGVPYIKVPTTLLAIVDASVGVKTSINHFGRRNRLGTYYGPVAAFLDTEFLSTLPPDEIHSAMGEIVKMAVIKNSDLFGMLEKHADSLIKSHFTHFSAGEIIWSSIDDMISELEPNLWEKNLKRCVDFGHSFSPLLEMNSISNDSVPSLSHGQAVALDVLFSSCLATHRGLLSIVDLSRVVEVCKACKLPISHPYLSNKLMLWESLLDTTRHRNGNQNLPVPNNIGSYVFLQDITLEDIEATIEIYEVATNECH